MRKAHARGLNRAFGRKGILPLPPEPNPQADNPPDWDEVRQDFVTPSYGVTVDYLGASNNFIEDNSTEFWTITDSDGFPFDDLVDTNYTRFTQLVAAVIAVMEANGDVPGAVKFTRAVTWEPFFGTWSHTAGATLSIIGVVDGNGEPVVNVKGGCSQGISSSSDPIKQAANVMYVKDMRIGVEPGDETSTIQNGDARISGSGIFHIRGGSTFVDNCRIVGMAENGITFDNVTIENKQNESDLRVYNTHIQLCGGGGDKHNLYAHASREVRVVRCVLGKPTFGHGLKFEGPRTVVCDCYFSNYEFLQEGVWLPSTTIPVEAAQLNYYRMSDVYVNGCVFVLEADDADPKNFVNSVGRRNAQATFSIKVPNAFGPDSPIPDRYNFDFWPNDIAWRGDDADNRASTTLSWQIYVPNINNTPVPPAAQDTSFQVRQLTWVGRLSGSNYQPGVGSQWTLRFLDRALNNYETAQIIEMERATVTAVTSTLVTFDLSTCTSTTVDGVAQGTPGELPVNMTASSPGVMHLSDTQNGVDYADTADYWSSFHGAADEGGDWEFPESLRSEYWNADDPNYYWGLIDDGAGAVDHTNLSKRNLYHSRFFTDCMFLWRRNTNVTSTKGTPIFLHYNHPTVLSCGGISNDMPYLPPPLNDPQGAWTGDPSWSTLDYLPDDFSTTFMFYGTPGSTNDYKCPYWTGVRNISYGPKAGGSMYANDGIWHEFTQAPSAEETEHTIYPETFLQLQSDGSAAALATKTIPAMAATTTVSGAHVATAETITIADATGVAVGQRGHIAYAPVAGMEGAGALQTFVVTAIDGTDIDISQPIARALAGGEVVHFFTGAGTPPAYWTDGVQS